MSIQIHFPMTHSRSCHKNIHVRENVPASHNYMEFKTPSYIRDHGNNNVHRIGIQILAYYGYQQTVNQRPSMSLIK